MTHPMELARQAVGCMEEHPRQVALENIARLFREEQAMSVSEQARHVTNIIINSWEKWGVGHRREYLEYVIQQAIDKAVEAELARHEREATLTPCKECSRGYRNRDMRGGTCINCWVAKATGRFHKAAKAEREWTEARDEAEKLRQENRELLAERDRMSERADQAEAQVVVIRAAVGSAIAEAHQAYAGDDARTVITHETYRKLCAAYLKSGMDHPGSDLPGRLEQAERLNRDMEKTLTGVVGDGATHEAMIEWAERIIRERDELREFKRVAHKTLDAAEVPSMANMDCRIKARIDWLSRSQKATSDTADWWMRRCNQAERERDVAQQEIDLAHQTLDAAGVASCEGAAYRLRARVRVLQGERDGTDEKLREQKEAHDVQSDAYAHSRQRVAELKGALRQIVESPDVRTVSMVMRVARQALATPPQEEGFVGEIPQGVVSQADVDEAAAEIRRQTGPPAAEEQSRVYGIDAQQEGDRGCIWTMDDAGSWDTGCGHKFEFIDDGPVENGMKFCPYCGGSVSVRDDNDDPPTDRDEPQHEGEQVNAFTGDASFPPSDTTPSPARDRAETLRDASAELEVRSLDEQADLCDGITRAAEILRKMAKQGDDPTDRNESARQEGERSCIWTMDEDTGAWDTGCGHKFEFINDGPEENGVEFCQYCGGVVKVRTKQENTDSPMPLADARNKLKHALFHLRQCPHEEGRAAIQPVTVALRCVEQVGRSTPTPAHHRAAVLKRLASRMRSCAVAYDECQGWDAATDYIESLARQAEQAGEKGGG